MVTPSRAFDTHEVMNQPPPFEDVNLFDADPALREAVAREGAEAAIPSLEAFGALTGSAEMFDLGRQANSYLPVLKSFDRYGHRHDRVEFHPSYHRLMAASCAQGLHASPWEGYLERGSFAPGAHVARVAGFYLMAQVEAGHICPITMTNASVSTLLFQPDVAREWLPLIATRSYDERFLPPHQKNGLTLGMGMTEKQGGTDVRANASVAEPIADGEGYYRITGHKWFMSAPMCDAFLVLAQAPGGLSCFLMPRILPDGQVNTLRFQRLKDKVGNKSNASSEVEFAGAIGRLIGEEGRGVRTIIEMASVTRLDCAVGSAGQMRQAVSQAVHHARHRRVFQKTLSEQPLMQNVLADLALEAEAAMALSLRLARSFDRAGSDPTEAAFRRLMTPVAKYWVCKRGPVLAYEAMECLGGNGYVEEGMQGRIFRDMPVNAIWEGSGNVMCLDVLRSLSREPESLEAVRSELLAAKGANRHFDKALASLDEEFKDLGSLEIRARSVVESLATMASASILVRHAPEAVSDAYCASRLGDGRHGTFGELEAGTDFRSIMERALVC